MTEKKKNIALQGKPCFPWVGGKRRLLPVLTESLPADFGKMETFVEPVSYTHLTLPTTERV